MRRIVRMMRAVGYKYLLSLLIPVVMLNAILYHGAIKSFRAITVNDVLMVAMMDVVLYAYMLAWINLFYEESEDD